MRPIHRCVLPYLVVGALLAGRVPVAQAAGPARPNIVFILADDSGLGEFGCYGGTAIPTPNVDRLAREGLLFSNAIMVREHVPSPHYDAPEQPGAKKGGGKKKAAAK